MSDLPTISLVTILHNWSEFYKLFKYTWEVLDYPKDKLEWIFIDTSKENHSDMVPLGDNILYVNINSKDYINKIDFKHDDDKVIWNYYNKVGRLPNGFLRDYSVGLTSHEYILHIDFDTIYGKNTIHRKLRFLNEHKLECTYCKSMLAYDIYGKGLYKINNPKKGYESTLFHTKAFWERGGFKWYDTHSEASSFYYGKGLEREMDNLYDSIKLLSIHNLNYYKPIKIEIENINIQIPEIIDTLSISQHPVMYALNDLYQDKGINVIGLESIIIDIIKKDDWNCNNIVHDNKKVKEKVIIHKIKEIGNERNDLCIINTKYPIWSILKKVDFDIIILETDKNLEQMDSILKENNYLLYDNIYFNRKFLIS